MTNYDYLYDKSFFGDKLEINHFSPKKLNFRIINNGIVLPHVSVDGTNGFGGVIDENGNFIDGTFLHRNTGGAYTPNAVINSPDTVVYFGMIVGIWGHNITDNLKRIWFFKNEAFRRYFRNIPTIYTKMWGGGGNNFDKMLRILGVSNWNLYPVSVPTRFKTIIVPDESFFLEEFDSGADKNSNAVDNYLFKTNAFFTKEYVETIDEIRAYAQKKFEPLDQKKYYFFHGQKGLGEEKLASYFEGKGYKIIHPERLNLKDELNLLANCESFASTVGSISHNVVFLPEHTETILIPRYVDLNLNQYQQALNQVHEQNIVYVDSALSVWATSQNGPFFYIVSYRLKEYFGDNFDGKYTDSDFEDFIRYAKMAENNQCPGNIHADKYYWTDTVAKFMKKVRQRKDILRRYNIDFK